jgi:hypothetical protein
MAGHLARSAKVRPVIHFEKRRVSSKARRATEGIITFMGLIGRIIGGLVLAGIGFLFVWKSEALLQNVGSIAWAEDKLGSMGGTRMFYKLFGLLIIFFGFMTMTGMFGGFVMGTVGRLFVPPGTNVPQ